MIPVKVILIIFKRTHPLPNFTYTISIMITDHTREISVVRSFSKTMLYTYSNPKLYNSTTRVSKYIKYNIYNQ